MKLLLSAARRTKTSQWICNSCRVKHASTSTSIPSGAAFHRPLASTIPATQLRERLGPARTRFAPSPTGYLHLGSLRTALFNYLIAKATGGQFLLRIEDTDQKRTVPDAEERLFQDLEWSGIEWDEGPNVGGQFGPYKQSQRTALYREHAEQLLQSGNAYRCFCSPERLNILAEHRNKLGLPPDYDRTCTHVSKEESDDRAAKGESHVIRLLVPKDYPVFNDLVYGLVKPRKTKRIKLIEAFDDPVLLKSDGFPTYHLANVVDDHLMKITHVIRGSEWMSSTPKHLAMYQAFGWVPPQYAHVGLLLGKDGQKLSKRADSASIAQLRDEMGVFPETLTNFVALLGWSHGAGNDVMNLQELVQNASMKYTRGDAVVTLDKLWFLQRRHAAKYTSVTPGDASNPSHDLQKLAVQPILELLSKAIIEQPDRYSFYLSLPEEVHEKYIQSIVWADARTLNYTTAKDFIDRNTFFFRPPTTADLSNTILTIKLRNAPLGVIWEIPPERLLFSVDSFSDIPEDRWNLDEIKGWINSIIDQGIATSMAELLPEIQVTNELQAGLKKSWVRLVHGYLRWAIAAGIPGPDGAETMRILGKDECISRLGVAREVIVGRMENEGFGSMDG